MWSSVERVEKKGYRWVQVVTELKSGPVMGAWSVRIIITTFFRFAAVFFKFAADISSRIFNNNNLYIYIFRQLKSGNGQSQDWSKTKCTEKL